MLGPCTSGIIRLFLKSIRNFQVHIYYVHYQEGELKKLIILPLI